VNALPEVQGRHPSRRLRGLRRESCERLLAALGTLLCREPVVAAATAWEPFQPVLRRHRLEGLVFARQAALPAPRAELPESFRRAYLANLKRSALYADEARRIVATAAGIPFVFVQGMALLALPGADPGDRWLSDLDVVVPPGDLSRFVSAMEGLGYRPKSVARFISWDLDGHFELVREVTGGELGLDVSSGTLLPLSLLSRHVRLEAESIVARSVLEDGLPLPAPADLLALCVLNVEQKDFGWLRPFVDVATLAAHPGLEWPAVVSALAREPNRGVAGAVLDTCRRWFSVTIPEWVLCETSTRSSPSVQGWQDFFLDPVTVCSQRAAMGRGQRFLPSPAGLVYGLARRFMAFRSWAVRARVLGELLTVSFAALDAYLYRTRSRAGRAFARTVLNPAVVVGGWLICHPLFVLSGAVLRCTRPRRSGNRGAP
jgi:hypothetical protein